MGSTSGHLNMSKFDFSYLSPSTVAIGSIIDEALVESLRRGEAS
jgi:hypothetical protein